MTRDRHRGQIGFPTTALCSLDYGFARVRCPQCKHEYLVAFSCKARGFCPSCQSKRRAEFAAFLTEAVLAPVPHRQV
ncbi:MAG: transposase zinc-binding domain-containing protein, partial [Planctomycetota bacterium]